jgi:hypothetical protein
MADSFASVWQRLSEISNDLATLLMRDALSRDLPAVVRRAVDAGLLHEREIDVAESLQAVHDRDRGEPHYGAESISAAIELGVLLAHAVRQEQARRDG